MQGLDVNVEYFSKVQLTECTDLHFRPLYKASNGKLKNLPFNPSKGKQPVQVHEAQAVFPVPEMDTLEGPCQCDGAQRGVSVPCATPAAQPGGEDDQEAWPVHTLAAPSEVVEDLADCGQEVCQDSAATAHSVNFGSRACQQGQAGGGVYQSMVPCVMMTTDMMLCPVPGQSAKGMKPGQGVGQEEHLDVATSLAARRGNGRDEGTICAAQPNQVDAQGRSRVWMHGMVQHVIPYTLRPVNMMDTGLSVDGSSATDYMALPAHTQTLNMQVGGGWRNNYEVYWG